MLLHDYINFEQFPRRVRELPTQFLDFPQHNTGIRGKWSQSTLLRASIEQYVHLLLRSQVVGYDKNRGGLHIKGSQIRKWFGQEGEGLLVEALGEFPLGDFLKEDKFYMLPSHHHRSAFLLYLYWNASNEVWSNIKREQISFRVFDGSKFTRLYCANDDMTKHPLYGFLRNPDMLLGHIISCDPVDGGKYHGRLSKKLSHPARCMLIEQSGYLQPLASLIYANCKKELTTKGEVKNLLENHAHLYNCRQPSKKMSNIPYQGNESVLQVDDEFLERMASAIEDFVLFKVEFTNQINLLRAINVNIDNHKKILSETAFFSFYIQDRIFFGLLPTARLVAERLSYHCNGPEDLSGLIRLLWNSDEHAINKRADKITEVLRKPIRKKAG